MDINWSKIILSESFFNRLEAMVRRSVVDEIVADEAITYILQVLSEDHWKKCREYSGKSSPETFLYSLCSNLIIDYMRKLYGRQRPPAWLKQKGPTWLAVWKELCLDRNNVQFIIDRHTQANFKDQNAINVIIQTIKSKLPWCGVSIRPESIDDQEEYKLPHQLVSHDDDLHDRMSFEQALNFAHLMLENDLNELPTDPLLRGSVQDIKAAVSAIRLEPQERLMLQMYFCDGLSGPSIAKALGIAKHQPVRLIHKILEKAKSQLLDIGVDLTTVDMRAEHNDPKSAY